MLICPSLSINKELKIKVEPLVVDTLNGKKVINPPFQSKGQKIIHARLLSYSLREGQVCKYVYSTTVKDVKFCTTKVGLWGPA